MIKITHGSIFDKKCDLLIIPCNAGGGVTSWVFENLIENSISPPAKRITPGKVIFHNTRLQTENAEVVGFAASVPYGTNSTTQDVIFSIAKDILNYCKSNEVRQINIPLLGTGAGGLSVFDSLEAMSSVFSKAEGQAINFEIFIPSFQTYENLKASYPELASPLHDLGINNPRVFISYASNDKENAEWVKDLAEKLIKNGVDAKLDRFHMKPGTDLPQWMTNEIIMADKVLLICDNNYMIKADIHKGGVGWETMVVQGDMLTQGESKNKYIAIVREAEIDKGLPIYMKSKLSIHWEKDKDFNEEQFKELLYAIFDCDIAPPLGPVPEFIKDKLTKTN